MAFSGNYVCTSYKRELLEMKHDFRSHTFKIALYDSTATLNASTTDYSATNEVTGTGYSAGGIALTAVAPVESGTGALADFNDATFSTVTLTARGALVYNTTTEGGAGTTNAVFVLDFGRDITRTAADFVVQMPTADILNAIVRIL